MSTATTKAFRALPRDARDAAARGFNFREGYLQVRDNFVDGSKMIRRGTMEISDDLGNTIEVPFEATFTFGPPRPATK